MGEKEKREWGWGRERFLKIWLKGLSPACNFFWLCSPPSPFVYACVYVCACVCMCVHTCACVYMCVSVWHIHVHAHVYKVHWMCTQGQCRLSPFTSCQLVFWGTISLIQLGWLQGSACHYIVTGVYRHALLSADVFLCDCWGHFSCNSLILKPTHDDLRRATPKS